MTAARKRTPKPTPKPWATLARVTIYQARLMSPWRRQDIAAWLRRQADDLVREGTNYSARFTGRYQTR